MQFKVGDKVRYNREFLVDIIQTGDNLFYSAIEGFEIVQIEGEEVRSEDSLRFNKSHLELVPEEPEFEYGEEVEVKFGEDGIWNKAIFLCKIPGDVRFPYACVDNIFKEDFLKGLKVEAVCWGYARKLKPQLTRKEIAEKFGVSEDFTLVD